MKKDNNFKIFPLSMYKNSSYFRTNFVMFPVSTEEIFSIIVLTIMIGFSLGVFVVPAFHLFFA